VVAGVEFDSLTKLLTAYLSVTGVRKHVNRINLRSGLEVLCGKQLVAFGLECVGHDYSVIGKSKGGIKETKQPIDEMWEM
jgi:hypothetical protein